MRPIEKIVIDANALLSIVIGGKAANRIVTHPKAPELYVTVQAYAEVEEYIPVLAQRKKLNAELLGSIWRVLPVEALEITEKWTSLGYSVGMFTPARSG